MLRRLIRFLTHADKREQIAALKAENAVLEAQIARVEAEIEVEARALEELRSRLP